MFAYHLPLEFFFFTFFVCRAEEKLFVLWFSLDVTFHWSHSSCRVCLRRLAFPFFVYSPPPPLSAGVSVRRASSGCVTLFIESCTCWRGWLACINKVFPTLPLTKLRPVSCLLSTGFSVCFQVRWSRVAEALWVPVLLRPLTWDLVFKEGQKTADYLYSR